MSIKRLSLILMLIVAVYCSCQRKVHNGNIIFVKPPFPTTAQIDSLEKINKLIGKKYILVDKQEQSDFNYKLLSNFDSLMKIYGIDSSRIFFKPIPAGKYTVNKFIATQKSWYWDSIADFNDILIVKTDKEGMIADAYQYTLEWGEYPFTSDLYRLTNKSVRLTNKLKIDTLKMQRIYKYDKEGVEILSDDGIVYLQP